MSVNKEETLRQFCDVTGTDEARSRFFLESSNWQLEVALSSFYEHGGNADEPPVAPPRVPTAAPTLSDSDMESPPSSPVQQSRGKKKPGNQPRFATLNTLQQESSSDEEEATTPRRKPKNTKEYCCNQPLCPKTEKLVAAQSRSQSPSRSTGESTKDDILKREIDRLLCENSELRKEIARLKGTNTDERGEAFYAGGSERSGQQIIGPPRQGKKDIVTEMFKSVRERGAVVFEDEPSTAGRGRGGGAFSGAGYRLGQTNDDHEQVPPVSAPTQTEQARSVRLRLYREGFTVDNGAVRQYSDPENAEFLSCIRRGEIPAELAHPGGEVRVSLEDRRHEECPRQGSASRHAAFTGKGQVLGSPTPTTVGATAPVAASAGDRDANQRAAQQAVSLDDSQPVTTVQFRLADGSRITGRFNHSHTVGDLQQYVSRAEPAYQLQTFALLTTFPSAELTDPSVSLADAKLLNTTLMQRLK